MKSVETEVSKMLCHEWELLKIRLMVEKIDQKSNFDSFHNLNM